jgi:hypothetical protein
MKYILLVSLMITCSLAYCLEKDIAVDNFGNKLQDKWGEPIYIDEINRKPVDKNGFPVKNENIFNDGGLGKYNNDKDIYDNNGFKAKRWDK